MLFLQAHPDDECILTGSTLAKASSHGVRTIVVYGTRGDAGETNLDLGGEALGDRRVREAGAACADLGVARIEWLPYDDSGMADTETTGNPAAFSNADPLAIADQLVELLADEQIQSVIGYDKNGTYGHPDHIQVFHVAHAVATKLGADWIFEATYDREFLASLPDADGTLDPNFASARADLTHFVGGAEWLDQKFAAITHHQSQVPDDMPTDAGLPAEFAARFGTEWFIATPVGDASTDLGVLAPVLEPKSAWPG